MSDVPDPHFYAWSDDADRVDAFVAALSALVEPGGLCSVSVSTLGVHGQLWREKLSADEVAALVRASFTTNSEAGAYIPIRLPSQGGAASLHIQCTGQGRGTGRFPINPLVARSGYTYLRPHVLYVACPDGKRSIAVEAVNLSMIVQEDTEDILVRFCAPDDSKRIPTGGFAGMGAYFWGAPIELAGTYNADGNVARDVALSWLYLHDGNRIAYIAGMSLDVLATRVEAAPTGATVGVSTDLQHLRKHELLEYDAAQDRTSRGTHVGAIRRVPRDRLPGDVDLTREQVLKVLEIPPATLLEALEAAAVPDDEWRSAEPLALEALAAKERGAPTVEVEVNTDRHRRFIERHAPYHVRRLPNGGVLLATHPYRTLWQLWASALLLLDIRTDK